MTSPLWSTLRSIGNSSLVRLSALFPFVGYFILFNDDVTNFLQAHGIEHPSLRIGFLDSLWGKKLYFLYFGLMFSGVGAMIYQWWCPREVKKHGDWKDYIAVEGETFSYAYLRQLAQQVGIHYIPAQDPKGSVGSDIMQHWYELQDAMFPYARRMVAGLFATSAILLAIPSSLTAVKVVARILS